MRYNPPITPVAKGRNVESEHVLFDSQRRRYAKSQRSTCDLASLIVLGGEGGDLGDTLPCLSLDLSCGRGHIALHKQSYSRCTRTWTIYLDIIYVGVARYDHDDNDDVNPRGGDDHRKPGYSARIRSGEEELTREAGRDVQAVLVLGVHL